MSIPGGEYIMTRENKTVADLMAAKLNQTSNVFKPPKPPLIKSVKAFHIT